MRPLAITISLLLLASCRVTYQNVTGTYVLENVPKTRLIINADTTFKFIKINEDPYLYTEDHSDQRFYFTTGGFRLDGKKLFLTSISDSLIYDSAKITIEKTKRKYSEFEFHDIYNDSVGAGYVILPDSTTIFGGFDTKKDFYHFGEDMTETKSLDFVFYGYGHWKYFANDNLNHKIDVQLMPVFRPNVFEETLFKIRGNTLVQNINGKRYKFKKTKRGM